MKVICIAVPHALRQVRSGDDTTAPSLLTISHAPRFRRDKLLPLLMRAGLSFLMIVGVLDAGRAFANDCAALIGQAEEGRGIPHNLLMAVAVQESGLDPFAVNAGGASFHPGSAAAAIALVEELQRRGKVYVDVGCMQVDLHHHPNAFASLEEAFDPAANVAYGAQYLSGLASRHGDWLAATAFYHSSMPTEQRIYLAQVARRYFALSPEARPPGIARTGAAPAAPPRQRRQVRLSAITVEGEVEGPGVIQYRR